MRIKKLLTGIFSVMMACPAFANVDIGADANSADCTNDILHTYSAPTSLEADWNANTIHLNWYLDSDATQPLSTGIQTSAQTCIYDGSITLPTTNPTKTGYTFAGWQVRISDNSQIQEPIEQCEVDSFSSKYVSAEPNDYYYMDEFETIRNDSGEELDEELVYILRTNEIENSWFAYYPKPGIYIGGNSFCSNRIGDYNTGWTCPTSDWLTTVQDLGEEQEEYGYCYCQLNTIVNANTYDYQHYDNLSHLVFVKHSNCNQCSEICAGAFSTFEEVRRAMLWISNQDIEESAK